MKKHVRNLVFGILAIPVSAGAQGTIVQPRAPEDAWQVRRAQTHAMIKVIGDENASQAQRARAMRDFDARLAAVGKGKLTPIEAMELLRVSYVPRELQGTPPHFDAILRAVATQATLGWYDALRFADDSGRAEISNNEAFFTLAFGEDASEFVQFMKDQPAHTAAAVDAGIQDARDRIEAGSIGYDAHWPASYGMLRVQCALQVAKTCEVPNPQPEDEWPVLLEQAERQVSALYEIGSTR